MRVGVRELEAVTVGDAVLEAEMVDVWETLEVREGEGVGEGVPVPILEAEGEGDTDSGRVGRGDSVPDTVGVALRDTAGLMLILTVPQEDVLGDPEGVRLLLPKGLEGEEDKEAEAH